MEQERRIAGDPIPSALGRLRVALDDAYLRSSRELGLTPQQAELLCAAMTPAVVGELAQALRCDRSNISRLVDRASARGWLHRGVGEEDGRLTVVELTPKGHGLARQFLALLEVHTQELRARWPENRKRLAAEVLNEISDALDASGRRSPERARGPRSTTSPPRRRTQRTQA